MNKPLIIGASIAGILGTMDVITTDPLKYGVVALLGITAFMTFNELNPQQKQAPKQQYQKPKTEEPKNIWEMFPKEAGTKEDVETKEVEKKELKFKVVDTNEESSKLQGTKEMQKVG